MYNQEQLHDAYRKLARFLEWEKESKDIFFVPNAFPEATGSGWTTFHVSEFEFLNDWNWLMAVIRLIQRIGREKLVNASDPDISYHLSKVSGLSVFCGREQVLAVALSFIDWFNQSQKQK